MKCTLYVKQGITVSCGQTTARRAMLLRRGVADALHYCFPVTLVQQEFSVPTIPVNQKLPCLICHISSAGILCAHYPSKSKTSPVLSVTLVQQEFSVPTITVNQKLPCLICHISSAGILCAHYPSKSKTFPVLSYGRHEPLSVVCKRQLPIVI